MRCICLASATVSFADQDAAACERHFNFLQRHLVAQAVCQAI